MSHMIKNDSLNLVWLIDWYSLVVFGWMTKFWFLTIKPCFWGNGKYALVAFFMLPFHSIFKVAIPLVLLCLIIHLFVTLYPLKFFSIYPGCKAIKGLRNCSVANLLTIVESYLKITFKREIS